MKKVYVYRGLPGSGKSTAARERMNANKGAYKRVNKDDLRAMLDNGNWSPANEKFLLRLRDHIILEALAAGKHVIVDDTNLHPKHVRRMKELIRGKAAVEIVDFMHVDLETCVERDLKRPNSVGERVIRRMWKQYLEWHGTENHGIQQDPNLPAALICDLDGTLAIIDHRNPFDASNADEDTLNEPVAEVVRRFARTHAILFVSGRMDKYREPTVKFIQQHLGEDFAYELIMRKSEDMRKDSIIKEEILRNKILPHYHVDLVLDDRNQVVDMWRKLGLPCFQVNYGDF